VLQAGVLVGRGLLHNARCQFVLMCVLSEAVIQLGSNVHVEATAMFDVVNLVELASGCVTVDKVVMSLSKFCTVCYWLQLS